MRLLYLPFKKFVNALRRTFFNDILMGTLLASIQSFIFATIHFTETAVQIYYYIFLTITEEINSDLFINTSLTICFVSLSNWRTLKHLCDT